MARPGPKKTQRYGVAFEAGIVLDPGVARRRRLKPGIRQQDRG